MMQEWSVQDWCAIIGAIIAISGVVFGVCKWIKRKIEVKKAQIRVNFFKVGKRWRFRVYNSSDEDIEALNVRVLFPDRNEYFVQWDPEKDCFPRLKSHESFDIYAVLYESSPRHTTVLLKWEQEGTEKQFLTTETVALK